MRRQEARLRRVLTIDDIPDELFAEYGLWRCGCAELPMHGPAGRTRARCRDHCALRKLNPDALRSLLRGVRDGDDLPSPPMSCFVSPVQPRRRCSTAYTGIGCLPHWASCNCR
jgi:hypothetical protein